MSVTQKFLVELLHDLEQLDKQAFGLKETLQSASTEERWPCESKIDRLRRSIQKTKEAVEKLFQLEPLPDIYSPIVQSKNESYKLYQQRVTQLDAEVIDITDLVRPNPDLAFVPPSTAPHAIGPDLEKLLFLYTSLRLYDPTALSKYHRLVAERENLSN